MKSYGWMALAVVVALSTLSCTPDWAKDGEAPVILLMTAINGGSPIDSDVAISNGGVCPDFAILRLENHFKSPNFNNSGFRHDIVVERYEVHYFRSDGHNTEGVDVPFAITGNLAQEVIEESTATLSVEVVRRQAKVEPPLFNLKNGGQENIFTAFAEVTLHARTTTGQATNSVRARLQIDFANFGDTQVTCPPAPIGG